VPVVWEILLFSVHLAIGGYFGD